MKVIFNSIYAIQVAVFMFYNTCNIGIEIINMILSDGWQAVLCPEDNMIQMLAIAGHVVSFKSK
jgi:hypothetical protein